MRRRIAVVVGLVSMVMAAAPAAWATSVPFNVHVPIQEQNISIEAGTSNDTGLVGVCDNELRCTGFRVTEATSPITGRTSAGRLTLRGYVCVMDFSLACSSNGIPFTGVKITERVVDTPEGEVDPAFVHVNFCLWLMSPQSTPYACNLPQLGGWELRMDDTGNVLDSAPVWFAFS